MSKTTLENLLDMLERNNPKKNKTEPEQRAEVHDTTTPCVVTEKLESIEQRMGTVVSSIQHLHEKIHEIGRRMSQSIKHEFPKKLTENERDPTPEPEPKSEPEPQPEPKPKPKPEPEPEPQPEPEPEPEPDPEPDPEPEPEHNEVADNVESDTDTVEYEITTDDATLQPDNNALSEPVEPVEQVAAEAELAAPSAEAEIAAPAADCTTPPATKVASPRVPRVLNRRIPGRRSLCMMQTDDLADVFAAMSPSTDATDSPSSPFSQASPFLVHTPVDLPAPVTAPQTQTDDTDTNTNTSEITADVCPEESYIIRIRDEAELQQTVD